jgi:hypothetical protein
MTTTETTQLAPASAAPHRMSRPELRGRASGVGVLAFFALAWSGWAVSTAPGVWMWAVQVPAGAGTLALIGVAGLLYRRARAAPAGQQEAGQREAGPSIGRRFGLVVLAEFVGLFVLAAILGASGHAEAIPAVVCAGVGVHFFPLARLFQLRLYDLTGMALCIVAVAAAASALATGTAVLWTAVSGFGAAAVLYATSAALGAQTYRRS